MNPEKMTIDDFQMISVIGKGSYAKVMLVKKKGQGNKLYALKILKKKYIEKRKQQKHIMAERNILKELEHPFLMKLFYSFQNEEKLFFALQYCPGGQMFGLLSKKKRLTEDQAKFYTGQIVLALEYLHDKNIIYRDLKPENVLIDQKGYIKLTDFGLSKMNIIDETAMSMCGTPEYLAPEVLQKQGHGKPVDWWCLGAILYEMVVGIPPFYSKSRHDLFEKIRNQPVQIPLYLSSKVKNLIEGLLTKKSESRLCSNSGAFEIRNHPWFEGMDWNGLINKTIKAPFIPTIKSDVDVSNFDAEFTQSDINSFQENQQGIVQNNQAFNGFSWQKSPEIGEGMDIQEIGDFCINIEKK